ncbi:MAG: EndoU domain-containing protein [Chitinophagaceae bacterium]|nr:EndoU domain-containing protein [Chitinophagaceae bacterium]
MESINAFGNSPFGKNWDVEEKSIEKTIPDSIRQDSKKGNFCNQNTVFEFGDSVDYKNGFASTNNGLQFNDVEFYTGPINFQTLCTVLKYQNGSDFSYSHKNFISTKVASDYSMTPSPFMETDTVVDTDLTLTDSLGQTKVISLKGRLNMLDGCVSEYTVYNRIVVNGNSEKESYTKLFYYAGFEGSNKEEHLAIELTCNDMEDYLLLSEYLGLYSNKGIIQSYNAAFLETRSIGARKFLYNRAPVYVLKQRGDDLLWHDLQVLIEYDRSSWHKDASKAMVRILGGFNDLQKMYQKLEQDPMVVMSLYKTINGTSKGNYCLFLDIISELYASDQFKPKPGKEIRVPYGKNYSLHSGLFSGSEDSVHLRVLVPDPDASPDYEIMPSPFSMFGDDPKRAILDISDLHPLQIVEYFNPETKNSRLVPVIYLKYLSDQEDWATIIKLLNVTFDIISLLVGVGVVLKGARGLAMILALADAGVALTDLALMFEDVRKLLKKTDVGEWLVDNWTEINFCLGIGIMGPILLKGLIEKGPAIIKNLIAETADQAKKFAAAFKQLIVTLKVELYVASYGKAILCAFDPITLVAQWLGKKMVQSMDSVGVMMGKVEEGDIKILLYKGKIIAEGTVDDIKRYLDKIFKKTGDDLLRHLDNLAEIGVLKLSSRFEDHMAHGHIRITVVDGSVPKKLPNRKPNPAYIIEQYEYLPGQGRKKNTIHKKYSFRLDGTGGSHFLKNLDNRKVKIIEKIETRKIPGGTVRIAKIEYWVEELGQWVLKSDKHTFWPVNWSMEKIKQSVLEAARNITYKKGNKCRGITDNGVEIEFYINEINKEIETAYIYFKPR